MADKITKIVEIELDVEAAKKSAASLTAEVSKLQTERTKLNKQLKELQKDEAKNGEEIAKVSKQLAANARQSKSTRSELHRLNKEITTGTGNLDAQRNKLARLNKQYDTFREGIDGTANDARKLQRRISSLTDEISKQEQSTGRFQRQVGNYKQALGGLGGGIGQLATVGGGIGLAVAGVAALGRGFIDLEKQVAKARREVQLFTKATGEQLDVQSARITALAETYGKDTQEILVAQRALSKQLGISWEEAGDVIEKGFLAGADSSKEFLRSITEYPTFFKEVGLSAQEATALIATSVTSGVFTDKGIDAIKEATLSLREMTPVTQEALRGIGLSAKEIQDQLASGEKSLFDVIQDVSSAMSEVDQNSPAVGAALADIFKGAGEDAGVEFIELLANMNLSLDELAEGASDTAKQIDRNREATAQYNLVINSVLGGMGDLSTTIDTLWKEGLFNLVNGFIDLHNNSLAVRAILGTIKTTIIALIDVMRLLWETSTILFEPLLNLLEGDFEQAARSFGKNATAAGEIFIKMGADAAKGFKDAFTTDESDFIKPLTLSPPAQKAVTDTFKKLGDNAGREFGFAVAKKAKATIEKAIATDSQFFSDLDRERVLDLIEIEEQEALIRQEASDTEKQLALDDALFKEELRAKELSDVEQHEQDKLDAITNTLNTTMQVASIVSTFLSALENKKLAELEGNEEAQEEIRKKFAQRQALLSIAQTLINGAVGIIKTGANVGYPAAIPLQVLQGAQTAASIALITSQMGKFEKGGIIQGKRHSQGGENFINPETGAGFQLERGEFVAVLNRNSTDMLQQMSALNQAGGGVSYFEHGGVFSADQSFIPQLSAFDQTADIEESIRRANIVVKVSDINKGQDNHAKVRVSSSQ